MCISYLNILLKTYIDGGMVTVGDINENILHESVQKHVHNFLIGSGFSQHIQLPITDYPPYIAICKGRKINVNPSNIARSIDLYVNIIKYVT